MPPFTDLRVRQAFDLALNKQLLVDRVFNGGGIPYAQEKFAWRLRPWVRGLRLNELLIMEDVDWPYVSITIR